MSDEMIATERFRALLDERGVEWTYADGTVSFNDGKHWYHAWAYNDGAMCVSMGYLTPEQAVEATLGRGTCRMKFTQAAQFGDPNDEDSYFEIGMFRCTACGTETYGMWNDNDECRELPRYCPNCRRKVEQ